MATDDRLREQAEQAARGEACQYRAARECQVTGPLCEDCAVLAYNIEQLLRAVQAVERQRAISKAHAHHCQTKRCNHAWCNTARVIAEAIEEDQ